MAATAVVIEPIGGIEVRISGDPTAGRHLSAEWSGGRAATLTEAPAFGRHVARLDVLFVHELPDSAVRRHKSVRWAATLAAVGDDHLQLRIALGGAPRWFGLSLVQGYLIEPALSLLAPQAGLVLLPAAGLVRNDEATILLGRSGTGKSSLSLRSLAAGLPVLGDDQVLVTADGSCRPFPRRLRLYADARRTAPKAVARLPRRYRMSLLLRAVVRDCSLGYVAPSLAVPVAALATGLPPATVRIGRVALLERRAGQPAVALAPADVETAVTRAVEALSAQRRELLATVGSAWGPMVDDITRSESALLRDAFAAAEIVDVSVPTVVPRRSAEAVAALAAVLTLP